MKKGRYSVEIETHGEDGLCYVARFKGKEIGRSAEYHEVIKLCRDHMAKAADDGGGKR